MIVTSNSVEHNYTIPSVTVVGDVDGFENVAERVEIYLNSSTTFDHTYETTIVDENMVSVASTVTESKTVKEFTQFGVDLSTSGLTAESFTAWGDLEEDQEVNSGEQYGLIRFGSRVDIYLPVGTPLNVAEGQRCMGGETIIADLSTKKTKQMQFKKR